LIELSIILIVLAVLVNILAPNVERYVRHAKIVRVKEDTQMLGVSIWMYMHDTGNGFFMQDGSCDVHAGASRCDFGGGAPDEDCHNRVNILVGDGDIPDLGLEGDNRWVQRVDFHFVDFMEYHLITNRPGNNPDRAYRTPLDLAKGANDFPGDPMFARDESGGFNADFAWRGPYVSSSIDADPWGNRYMANVGYLDSCAEFFANHEPEFLGFTYDVIVMSSGPDEEVDTAFERDGLVPGDDDIAYLVSANGP